jgi:hypothetical protein
VLGIEHQRAIKRLRHPSIQSLDRPDNFDQVRSIRVLSAFL